MIVKNMRDEIICKNAKTAITVKSRLLGLMFTADLPMNEGLLLKPCNSIHTFFMKYNLDIIFLDSKFRVVKVIYNMKPWRISWMYLKANQVLEMKAGNLRSNIEIGEQFEVLCTN